MAILDNLEAYWKMDEASGARADSHGSNNLVDNNTVTQATGKIVSAGQFTTANSEYLNLADNASLSVGDIDFTWIGWMYLDATGVNRTMVSKGATGAAASIAYLIYYSTGDDRFKFWVGDNATHSAIVLANNLGAPSTAAWYFIVAWHDATANTINIQVNNGTVDSTAYTYGSYDDGDEFCMGKFSTQASAYMDGRIDEVGFWKRVLTSTEKTDLYNGGAGWAYPFTVAAAGGMVMMV